MGSITEKRVKRTLIPLASVIVKGSWDDPTFLIQTDEMTYDEHQAAVNEECKIICEEYAETNHPSVSLRFEKQEIVFENERYLLYATLVMFRVRDSY